MPTRPPLRIGVLGLVLVVAVALLQPTGPSPAAALSLPGGPGTPAVTLTPGVDHVDVEWEPVADADRYRYRHRQGRQSWSANTQTTGTSARISGLEPGGTYTIAVGARINGKWSSKWTQGTIVVEPDGTTTTTGSTTTTTGSTTTTTGSTTTTTTSPDMVEVVGPTASSPTVRVTPTHSSLSVSWDEVPGATEYQYRYRVKKLAWSAWQYANGPVEITGLQEATSHSVQVRARVDNRWKPKTTVTLDTLTYAPPPPHHHGPPPTPGVWVEAADEVAVYTDDREPTSYFAVDPFAVAVDDERWTATRIGWLVKCESVKVEQIDPIAQPGVSHGHHAHEFFGNPNVDPNTTTQSLMDTPMSDIECTDLNDKSAYWAPVVYQDGYPVEAVNFSAYYKSTTPDVVPMPDGLRIIAGNAGATSNESSALVGYWMSREASTEEVFSSIGATEMITPHRSGVALVLRINYPNCWDGVHLDSPDHQSHMAYFDEETKTCPASHPVKVPQLTTFTSYGEIDGGAGLTLSSGPWYTFHQDFWNAWSPNQMDELTQACLVDELNCRVNRTSWLQAYGQQELVIPATAGP